MKKLKGIDGKLDDAWSELVKLRAGMRCEFETNGVRCNKVPYTKENGRKVGLQSHHIWSRSNRSVRWDVENGVCLCPMHHTLGQNSAHKAPTEFIYWLESKRGTEYVDELRLKANATKKWTKHEKEELLEELKKQIDEINRQD